MVKLFPVSAAAASNAKEVILASFASEEEAKEKLAALQRAAGKYATPMPGGFAFQDAEGRWWGVTIQQG